jgi:hypothetical protein
MVSARGLPRNPFKIPCAKPPLAPNARYASFRRDAELQCWHRTPTDSNAPDFGRGEGRGISEDPLVRWHHTDVGIAGDFASGGIMMRWPLLGLFNRCHEEQVATLTTRSCGFERDCMRSIPNGLRSKLGRVDGFDQDEGAGQSDEGAVVSGGFFAA